MADRKLIQFVGTDGNEYDVRDEAAQQMIGTTALPTTAQTLTGAIAEHETDLGTKADKVASAVNGNFAGLDGNGNLTDSGSKASDFVPVEREINGKALSANVTLTGDDITVSAEDEQTVSDAISELNTAVESKADQTQVDDIEKELTGKADKDSVFDYKGAVPGDVVEVYDAVAEAVKSMQIEIAPVQDLHGYDHPWVGGAGKNLFDKDTVTSGYRLGPSGALVEDSSYSTSDFIPVKASTAYTRSKSFSTYEPICFYNASKEHIQRETNGSTVTTTAETAYVRTSIATTDLGTTQLEQGSTVTAWEPYSNICPISGWTGANITDRKKNLLPKFGNEWVTGTTETYYAAKTSDTTPTFPFTFGTSGSSSYTGVPVYVLECKPSTTYTIKPPTGMKPIVSEYATLAGITSKANALARWTDNTTGYSTAITKTTNASARYLVVSFSAYSASASVTVNENTVFQLEEGSSATTFEAFAKHYNITFPSGQTIYGGTLTVNADGTGTLVVDKKSVDLGSLSWSTNGSRMQATLPSDAKNYNTGTRWNYDGICSQYKADSAIIDLTPLVNGVFGFYQARVLIYDAAYSDATAFASAVNGQTVIYNLETALNIPLTAPQIRTILGYNRIYANTGSILSMLYPAERYQTAEQADRERIHAVVDEPSAVVSITDGADNVPMGMQIAIEPVQDLHGQETPYPGGGSNNMIPDGTDTSKGFVDSYYLLSDGTQVSNSDLYISEYFPVTADTVYSYSATTKLNAPSVNFYDSSKTFISGVNFNNVASKQVTTPANAAYARSSQYKDANNVIIQFEIGSSPTTIKPYSNICPITGWTGAEISRTGKNLIDAKTIYSDTSNFTWNGEIVSGKLSKFRFVYIPIPTSFVGKTLTFSAKISTDSSANNVRVCHYTNVGRTDGNKILANSTGTSAVTFIAEESSSISFYYGTDGNISVSEIQLELGSMVTSYESYRGDIYTITFPTAAGTVYGGTLTVNKDGTGELVVDTICISGSEYTWTKDNTYQRYFTPNLDPVPTDFGVRRNWIISDSYRGIYDGRSISSVVNGDTYIGTSTTGFQIYVHDNRSAEEFNATIGNVHFCYHLGSPITYTLPAPVIRSLLGNNAVWASTGNVLHLDYTADGKLYIDTTDNRITSVLNAMVAPVLPSMVADTALSVNDFRIVNDTLYRVTASIASGGTLTVGTNVVKTSIGEQITALLNAN